MSDDGHKGNRRFTFKGRHVLLAAAVLLVGAIVLYIVIHRGDIERRLAALRAAGYPTTFAELAEYTKLPEGAENAAELYTRAFAAFVAPVDEVNVPLLGQAQWPDRGATLLEPMAKAVSECLASNQQCLLRLREAAALADCRYGWDFWPGIPEAHVQTMRRCGQLLSLGAVHHMQRGDTDAATVCIKEGLRLSDSMRREPALIGYLIRIALINTALGGLERSLSLGAFTDSQLNEIDAALVRTGGTLDFTMVLATERCFMIETCRDPSLLGPAGQTAPVRLPPGMRGTWMTDILDLMEDHIAASRLPPRERLKRFRQADDRVQQLSVLHVMIKMMAPGMSRVAEHDVRVRARLDLARTALALERYRLAAGRAPVQLPELVPQYLERVPLDPFDEQPIRYRRTDPGYLLYSVDADGQDHGGRERDDTRKDESYDLCFTVPR